MKGINTYLIFDGNCREAVKFYEKCLKADLLMMPFAEMPGDVPPEAKDRIMHAKLTRGEEVVIMASDNMPGMPFQQGNNFSVSINCEGKQEVDELIRALGDGGKVTMPAQETFWGAYFAMLTDKFGINWMLNHDLPQKK